MTLLNLVVLSIIAQGVAPTVVLASLLMLGPTRHLPRPLHAFISFVLHALLSSGIFAICLWNFKKANESAGFAVVGLFLLILLSTTFGFAIALAQWSKEPKKKKTAAT